MCTANLRKILQQFTKAGEDKELLAQAFDELEPLITAANIGEATIFINTDSDRYN